MAVMDALPESLRDLSKRALVLDRDREVLRKAAAEIEHMRQRFVSLEHLLHVTGWDSVKDGTKA